MRGGRPPFHRVGSRLLVPHWRSYKSQVTTSHTAGIRGGTRAGEPLPGNTNSARTTVPTARDQHNQPIAARRADPPKGGDISGAGPGGPPLLHSPISRPPGCPTHRPSKRRRARETKRQPAINTASPPLPSPRRPQVHAPPRTANSQRRPVQLLVHAQHTSDSY